MFEEEHPEISDYPEQDNAYPDALIGPEVPSAPAQNLAADWPVYLCLGTIALTALIIIIINLAGRKRRA